MYISPDVKALVHKKGKSERYEKFGERDKFQNFQIGASALTSQVFHWIQK